MQEFDYNCVNCDIVCNLNIYSYSKYIMTNNFNNPDFDNLVIQVNESSDEIEEKTSSPKKNRISKMIKMILDGILSMNIFWSNPINLDELQARDPLYGKWLTPQQIDAVHLASDWYISFKKTKEQFEKEKQWKDPEAIKAIEQEIATAKKIYDTMYDYYKKYFYTLDKSTKKVS